MIIGLKRGTVELVEYKEGWEEAGRECIRLLSSILGEKAVAIEHVGSTAIPVIHAKPIIDIAQWGCAHSIKPWNAKMFLKGMASSSMEKTTQDSFSLS